MGKIKDIFDQMTAKDWLRVGELVVSLTGVGIAISKTVEKSRERKFKSSLDPKWVDRRKKLQEEELEKKKKELELQNEMHAERTRQDCEIKREYEHSAEADEKTVLAKAVKERICKLLNIGVYRPAEECNMLEDDEKTSTRVKPIPLVGDLIKKGDRVVIAGTAGVGKSIMAVQLADDISKGKASMLLSNGSGYSKGQLVYLYDAEQDKHDRQERYGCVTFDNKLRRMKFKFPTVYYALEDAYNRVAALNEDATFIYDNLFAIWDNLTGEQTKDLLDGFKTIQDMADERGIYITFIIITHTIKEVSGIPEMSDIAGSANLSRFARSIYLLAKTNREGEAMFVNDKCRHGKMNRISVLRRVEEPMLRLEYMKSISVDEAKKLMKGQSSAESSDGKSIQDEPMERIVPGTKYTMSVIEEVIKLKNEGMSFRDIADYMKAKGTEMSQTTAMKLYNKFTPKQDLTPAVA